MVRRRGRPQNTWKRYTEAEQQQMTFPRGQLQMLFHDRDGGALLKICVPTGFNTKAKEYGRYVIAKRSCKYGEYPRRWNVTTSMVEF